MNNDQKKGLKEAFAVFFEDPSRESLRKLLIDHTGEHDYRTYATGTAIAKRSVGIAN